MRLRNVQSFFLILGWGGQGLGKQESGIVDPIKQGEVRDRQDKFKVKQCSLDCSCSTRPAFSVFCKW